MPVAAGRRIGRSRRGVRPRSRWLPTPPMCPEGQLSTSPAWGVPRLGTWMAADHFRRQKELRGGLSGFRHAPPKGAVDRLPSNLDATRIASNAPSGHRAAVDLARQSILSSRVSPDPWGRFPRPNMALALECRGVQSGRSPFPLWPSAQSEGRGKSVEREGNGTSATCFGTNRAREREGAFGRNNDSVASDAFQMSPSKSERRSTCPTKPDAHKSGGEANVEARRCWQSSTAAVQCRCSHDHPPLVATQSHSSRPGSEQPDR
jgi:hypothetical protein